MAMSIAKHAAAALSREKPRSSITEWVDILTSPSYDDEVYDGIPQLIDSIDLQSSGPTEASRAVRKKIKHGNTHQQYRALVILNALVENCGQKFLSTFADGQLTDAIKHLATDSTTDPKVKKKVLAVLASWHRQFKDDSSMALVAGLYRQVKPQEPPRRPQVDREAVERAQEADRKRIEADRKRIEEKAEAKRRAKMEKEAEKDRIRRDEEARRKKTKEQAPWNKSRKAFNFEQEKPQVMTSIANASSSANNLVNAITLVNTETDSLQENDRVQECLGKAKLARKPIVRYIQLVHDEEFIGTLIEANERIIAALETYDKLSKPDVTEKDVEDVQQGLTAAQIGDSEVQKLQDKQRAAVQRAVVRRTRTDESGDHPPKSPIHPDLQDLSFGALGTEQRNLQPPIRPNSHATYESQVYRRGSLSDFSDYESSDEETRHTRPSASGSRKAYVNVSDDEGGHGKDTEDPFADPFAD